MFGVEGTLFSAPGSDIVTTVAVVFMDRKVMKELNSKIPADEAGEIKAIASNILG